MSHLQKRCDVLGKAGGEDYHSRRLGEGRLGHVTFSELNLDGGVQRVSKGAHRGALGLAVAAAATVAAAALGQRAERRAARFESRGRQLDADAASGPVEQHGR